jgi:hypothetical protein
LKIDAAEDVLEPAYVKIRFKNNMEKGGGHEMGGERDEGKESSIIEQFLENECHVSQFASDYISF